MISVNIKIDDGVTPVLKGMKAQLNRYPQDAEKQFKSLTPIDTGNARRNTRLVNNDTIEANYPYAVPLDNGHSKQAPQGMTKPFEKWVRGKLKQIFGK
jgi:hypothetical protein